VAIDEPWCDKAAAAIEDARGFDARRKIRLRPGVNDASVARCNSPAIDETEPRAVSASGEAGIPQQEIAMPIAFQGRSADRRDPGQSLF
jgi:hypothetical protein